MNDERIKVIKKDEQPPKPERQREVRAEITMLEILVMRYPEPARRFVRKVEPKTA